jgi:Spy/CpxP family protein refolding chaperone
MQKFRLSVAMTVALLAASSLAAQPTPYAGQQEREIKALSDQEVSDYLAGKGMGLAKAAELNGYPGPAHVLELASELRLNAEQRKKTEGLFKTMQSKAITAGRALVDEEKALDRLFASKAVTVASLQDALKRIADLQARVRLVHLETHLAQVAILSPEQIARYSELRGYTKSGPHKSRDHGAH